MGHGKGDVRMTATANGQRALLEMRDISKTFGASKALSQVSLTVHPGEVHALMGENGAGKSTLMKILSGAYTADPGGLVLIDGETVTLGDPLKAKAYGIAVIYQELSLAPNLTVAQNMFLGNEPSRFGLADRAEMRRRAEPILKQLGIGFDSSRRVAELSLGERQMVEIARALTTKARIIVMDEPTTSLTSRETDRLFDVIARLKADGIAIIYISHRMEEIYQLSDRVSVLRDGAYVGTLDRGDLSASKLVSMMVGRDLSSFYKKEHRQVGSERAAVLSVKNIGDGNKVHDCSFEVRAGEVLGIAGLVGSGRTELARLVYGADHRTSGDLVLNGKPLAVNSPRDALDAGIAYLTEDRKVLGLFLDMSISDNINIGVLSADAKAAGVRDFARARERAVHGRHADQCRRAVRRQPAEGAARPPAGDEAQGHHSRRTNAWRRCRRQVGNLPDHRRACPERHRHHRHLQRPAGNPRHCRPRARDARGAHRWRGDGICGSADRAGSDHGACNRFCRPRGMKIHRDEEDGVER
jgi:ribose transport system ATP-binding protein